MAGKSAASSQLEKLVRVSAAAMRPLTRRQLNEVKRLIAKPDSEIDFSDIAETVVPFISRSNDPSACG
jgi:hypothetical protein